MVHLTISYPSVAQFIAGLLWEREARVRAEALGNPGKPWDTWADSTFPLADNWSKIGVDHMFDHNWKNFITGCSAVGSALALGESAQATPQLHIRV